MNILFLDIDGVLNHRDWLMHNSMNELCPECLARLRSVCLATDCRIVISSTWRLMFKGDVRGVNHRGESWNDILGTEIANRIVGMTPISSSGIRGNEIDQFLVDFGVSGTHNYLAVDDDSDIPEDILVKTDFLNGLTEEKANEIIKRFRNGNNRTVVI